MVDFQIQPLEVSQSLLARDHCGLYTFQDYLWVVVESTAVLYQIDKAKLTQLWTLNLIPEDYLAEEDVIDTGMKVNIESISSCGDLTYFSTDSGIILVTNHSQVGPTSETTEGMPIYGKYSCAKFGYDGYRFENSQPWAYNLHLQSMYPLSYL